MSPKESYVLILSFPSVWLRQVNSEREETLTNPERPNRAEMGACPDQEVGVGAGDPTGLEMGARAWLMAGERRHYSRFKGRKEKTQGVGGRPSPHPIS